MDDACPGFPETEAVPCGTVLEEAVDLVVLVDGDLEVGTGTLVSADQVVAVHGRRYRHLGNSCLGELQQRHLGRSVLQRHAVRPQLHVTFPGA